jgi:hypothetical protein
MQVRELIQQFSAAAPLALVLKKFLADRSLDHPYSGGLSSYCLVSINASAGILLTVKWKINRKQCRSQISYMHLQIKIL